MPDRAVADDDAREQEVLERLKGPWHGWHTCGNCGKWQTVYCQDCGEPLPEHEEPDRAVVAISEDRQWLVVLDPHAVARASGIWMLSWSVLRWDDISFEDYGFVEDTGQSADEVLATFLRENHA